MTDSNFPQKGQKNITRGTQILVGGVWTKPMENLFQWEGTVT